MSVNTNGTCTFYNVSRNGNGTTSQNHDHNGDNYLWIFILRRVVIGISAIALIINIIIIIRKKQYKFNTIRLFLFVQIFYVISLVSVTPHNQSFNLKQELKPPEQDFQLYMECLIEDGSEYKCAIEGFVNLTCYSISYWFAVCVTLYIRLVLQNKHKRFMKQKGPFIFAVISFIIMWYIIPFILTFIHNMPFSFGPVGYRFQQQQYLFYAGIVYRDKWAQFLVYFWMLFLPVSMFAYHLYILWGNYKYTRRLKQLDQINPRQFFLIKSGKLSFLIFGVQIFNVVKLILGLSIKPGQSGLIWLVFILNIIFDLLALVLITMYLRNYYRQGRKLQEDSSVMENSIVESFSAVSKTIL